MIIRRKVAIISKLVDDNALILRIPEYCEFFDVKSGRDEMCKFLIRRFCKTTRWIFVSLVASGIVGCAGAGEGAAKGAAGGALAGAASGLISSLVWGGDPGEHMARGAVAGATVGAVGGAIEGSSRASAEKERQAAQDQRELDQFRRDIGDDAYAGVVALVDCRHAVALANAEVAAESNNSNHALAGLWVQALTHADQGDDSGLHEVAPEIIRWDREIANTSQFDSELKKAHDDLMDIRSDYMLPRSCND